MSKTTESALTDKVSITVFDQISSEDKAALNEQIIEQLTEITEREDALKVFVSLEKAALKALKADLKKNVKDSKIGTIERVIQVNPVPNLNTGSLDFIDDAGTVRRSRRLTAEERQYMMSDDGGTIISFQKAVNS